MIDVNTSTILRIASSGWPRQVGSHGTADATPIVAGRLSDQALWRINACETPYVLRGWPPDEVPRAGAAARFAEQVAQGVVVGVAVPIASAAGSGLVEAEGLHWQLAPWLAGESSYGPQPSRDKLIAMCQTLADLHQAAAGLPTVASVRPIDRYLDQLNAVLLAIDAGQFGAVRTEPWEELGYLADRGLERELEVAAGQVRARLAGFANRSLPTQWVWGDAWHSNFLFDGACVAGVIDFAAVRVDTPAADLARLLGSACGDEPKLRAEALGAYLERRRLSTDELSAIALLHDAGTVLSLANWVRWLCIEDRRFASGAAARQRLAHFAERLAELNRR